MSASAARAAAKPQTRKRELPAWTGQGNPWAAVPLTLLTHVLPALGEGSAPGRVLLCLTMMSGKDGVATMRQSEIAKTVQIDLRTVQECIVKLAEIKAIEIVKVKRTNAYRLLVESWSKVKKTAPKVVEPVEEPTEETAEVTPIDTPRPQPTFDIETGTAVPITLRTPARSIRCENASGFPITVETTLEANVVALRICSKANVANTGVNGTIHGRQTVYLEFAAMLDRQLGRWLVFTPDDLTKVHGALGTANVDDLERRIRQRYSMFTGGKGTVGGVIRLAEDCAKIAAARKEGAFAPVAEDDGQMLAQVKAEARRILADPFLGEEDREYYIEYGALEDWMPSQVEVDASVRGTAQRVKELLADRSLPVLVRNEKRALRERIRNEFPAIYAEVFS